MDISTNDFVKGLRLLILYGSQTGTSQDVAENIAMQSRGSHFRASAIEIDSFPIQKLIEERLAIFVCSTTGQGDSPDNMKKFWRFIMRKNLPNDSLHNLHYAVLGLGDSSYAKYNFIAKKLDRRLQQLGGNKFAELGLADDQHEWGADATVDPWVTGVWKKLLEMHPLPNGMLSPLDGVLPPPCFQVNLTPNGMYKDNEDTVHISSDGVYDRRNPFLASVMSNQRATAPNHFQKTMHVVMDISQAGGKLSYEPGDVVMIKPSNTEDNVKKFLEMFSCFDPEELLSIISNDKSGHVPTSMRSPTTLRQLATDHFDFMSVPRRSFFQMLQHFATDETEKEKLIEFAVPEGTDERHSYANRPRRTILEVFEDFHKTAKVISLGRLLEVIPSLQPRAFSIASSPTHHKDEIHVLVAVVKYKTMLHLPRQGLCSTWLSTLTPGSKVPIWVKTGGIQINSSNTVKSNKIIENNFSVERPSPCIMIGPGTGVAPFRSAIHERICNGIKDNVLFFGCRNRKGDFYFEDEWTRLVSEGSLTLHTAFSRDDDEKIYVQHRIAEQGAILWNLIKHKNAVIYVAGNSKNMPDGVRDAFLKIFEDFGELSDKEAKDFYEKLQKEKRYQQETWS